MSRARIQFRFLSPWHVSSGRGGGPAVDDALLRTAEGLPYVPGRAVKGLFRDAVGTAEAVQAVPPGTTRRLFGSDLDELAREPASEIATRYRTQEGLLRFDNATLPDSWRLAAREDPAWAAELVEVVAATAMENGVAKEASLRTFEVAVPMSLVASVEGPEDGRWVEVLRTASPFLRGAGAHRHRGYGRVAVQVEEAGV